MSSKDFIRVFREEGLKLKLPSLSFAAPSSAVALGFFSSQNPNLNPDLSLKKVQICMGEDERSRRNHCDKSCISAVGGPIDYLPLKFSLQPHKSDSFAADVYMEE